MNRLLYIIGPPGVGKTTLMAELTRGQRRLLALEPFAHTVYDQRVCELGYQRRGFSGTDTLALNVQPKVVAWLRQRAFPWVLAEGDRLANGKFFAAVRAMGYELLLVALVGDEVARDRAVARAAELGLPLQDATWAKGRATKVANLIAQEPGVLCLPASLPPDAWARILRAGGWHPWE